MSDKLQKVLGACLEGVSKASLSAADVDEVLLATLLELELEPFTNPSNSFANPQLLLDTISGILGHVMYSSCYLLHKDRYKPLMDLLECLLRRHREVVDQDRHFSLLHKVACMKDARLVELLLKMGADVNFKGVLGSVLHYVEDVECAERLLAAGAKVNPGHNRNQLPLLATIRDPRVLLLLLKAGAVPCGETFQRLKDYKDAQLYVGANARTDDKYAAVELLSKARDNTVDILRVLWEGEVLLPFSETKAQNWPAFFKLPSSSSLPDNKLDALARLLLEQPGCDPVKTGLPALFSAEHSSHICRLLELILGHVLALPDGEELLSKGANLLQEADRFGSDDPSCACYYGGCCPTCGQEDLRVVRLRAELDATVRRCCPPALIGMWSV